MFDRLLALTCLLYSISISWSASLYHYTQLFGPERVPLIPGLHVSLRRSIVGTLLSPDSEDDVSCPVLIHSVVDILKRAKNVN